MRRIALALAAAAIVAAPAAAEPAKGGKVTWLTSFADAQAAAKKGGKAIVIDAGRQA